MSLCPAEDGEFISLHFMLFFKIPFNIIFTSTTLPPEWCLPFRFSE
jgi:hypothetical protein